MRFFWLLPILATRTRIDFSGREPDLGVAPVLIRSVRTIQRKLAMSKTLLSWIEPSGFVLRLRTWKGWLKRLAQMLGVTFAVFLFWFALFMKRRGVL